MPQHPLDNKEKFQKGYLAIFAVIMVISVILLLVLSFSVKSYHSILNSRGMYKSNQAKALANMCGLKQIRDLNTFTGSNTLTLGSGSCTYMVSDLGGTNRQVNSSGVINNIIRKVKIMVVSVAPIVTVSSWQEVADF